MGIGYRTYNKEGLKILEAIIIERNDQHEIKNLSPQKKDILKCLKKKKMYPVLIQFNCCR